MTPLPKEPAGDAGLVTFCKQVLRCLRERTIIPGQNIQVERTSNGIKVEAKAGNGGGAGRSNDKPVWL